MTLPGMGLTDADRDLFTAVLGEHYAAGRLDDAGLARRVHLVLTASDLDQAGAALEGLPAMAAPQVRRRRWGKRHGEAPGPRPGWVPTSERFRDPSSGAVMRVWVDAGDGSRHYLADGSVP